MMEKKKIIIAVKKFIKCPTNYYCFENIFTD